MKKIFSSPSSFFKLTFFNNGGLISSEPILPEYLSFFEKEFEPFYPLFQIYDNKFFIKLPPTELNLLLSESQNQGIINCNRLIQLDLLSHKLDLLFYQKERFLKEQIDSIPINSTIVFRKLRKQDPFSKDHNLFIQEGIFLGRFSFISFNYNNKPFFKEDFYLVDVNGSVELIDDIFRFEYIPNTFSSVSIFNKYDDIFHKYSLTFDRDFTSLIPVSDIDELISFKDNPLYKDNLFLIEYSSKLNSLKKKI